jgi:hypothetical protein
MIKYYWDIKQGTDEWHALRCGIVTASQVKSLLTGKTLKIANNDTVRTLAYEFAAQRETGRTEENFQNYHMMRGHLEEELAFDVYSSNYYKARKCGFITNDKNGIMIGYSPDLTVYDDGLGEIKARVQKHQVRTILEDIVPAEFILQQQTGLYVSEREWCDFISYSNGMPLYVKRVYPDLEIHEKIATAIYEFDKRVKEVQDQYKELASKMVQTERVKLDFDDEIYLEKE